MTRGDVAREAQRCMPDSWRLAEVEERDGAWNIGFQTYRGGDQEYLFVNVGQGLIEKAGAVEAAIKRAIDALDEPARKRRYEAAVRIAKMGRVLE